MAAPAQAKIPAGMGMLLKSLGVDMSVIPQVVNAVQTIADKLQRIEEQNKKILAYFERDRAPESSNGHGGS